MIRILVSGAGGPASFNFITSIRRNPKKEKFYIVGIDTNGLHMELSPLDKKYIVPHVQDPNYISEVNAIIKNEKIDFFHIQPDVEIKFISKNRKKFPVRMFIPKEKTIDICQNKMLTNSLLEKNKVSVPRAYLVENEKDMKNAVNALLKMNGKAWLRAIRGAGSRAALPIYEIDHARSWIKYWNKVKGIGYGDFMLSEFLPGKEYAFQSIWMNGELIMSQARERIEYVFGNLTPSGQSSSPSIAKTVNNDEVNSLAYNAIKAIDPDANGIFCVDMKTGIDGKIKVIEINAGRFFTTSYFLTKAGINMPYYYLKLGLGSKIGNKFKKFNNLREGLYWVRAIDMGYKLLKKNKWETSKN